MKKIVLIGCLCLSSLLYADEPSVYGAGDIDSANPYGLTKAERDVLSNRRAIQNLKNKVAEQQNRIDGLISIIDGLNKKVLSLKEELKSNNNLIRKVGDDNRTYSMLLELGKMVDKINNSYVTNKDLKEALSRVEKKVQQRIESDTTSSSEEDSSYNFFDTSVDISTIYTEGVKLFSKRSYSSAKKKFKKALDKGYKKASSSYYLGEIAYHTNNYPEAIKYYKQSSALSNNASYMPTLYLHTAISLQRDGQYEQAKNFFRFLIDNYPATKAYEIAKKNLE